MYREEKTVIIKRKLSYQPRRGSADTEDFKKKYISASLRHRKPLSGLTDAEERKFLPNIIGMNPKDNMWQAAVREYWNNLRVGVPADGLPLQVGFDFETEALAASCTTEQEKASKGTPINISDYVLYRYCLEWGRVANIPEDKDKSNNIFFFIEDKQHAVDIEYKRTKITQEATVLSVQLMKEPEKLDNILTMFNHDVVAMNDKNKTIELSKVVTPIISERIENGELIQKVKNIEEIKKFISFCKDDKLITKAFIKRCLREGVLKRLDNTEVVIDAFNGDKKLGNTLKVAAEYLEDVDNANYKTELQDRLTKAEGKRRQIFNDTSGTSRLEGRNKSIDLSSPDNNISSSSIF